MGATVVGTKVTPTLMIVKISVHAHLEILKMEKSDHSEFIKQNC